MNSGSTGPRLEAQTLSSSSEVCSSMLKGQGQPGGTLGPQDSTSTVVGGKATIFHLRPGEMGVPIMSLMIKD